MGEVSAEIVLENKNELHGWTYVQWIVDFGKGEKPMREDVTIKCAETSQGYLSRQEAIEEAKGRIMLKIQKECGDYPEKDVRWIAAE